MIIAGEINVRDMLVFQGMGGYADHSANGCAVISLLIAIAALCWIDTADTAADIIQNRCPVLLSDIRDKLYPNQGRCTIDEEHAFEAIGKLGDEVRVKHLF
jgi:hypothetical protein